MERLQVYLRDHFEQWLSETTAAVHAAALPNYDGLSTQGIEAQLRPSLRAIADAIISGNLETFREMLHTYAVQQAQEGVPVEDSLKTATAGIEPTLNTIARLYSDDPQQAVMATGRYFQEFVGTSYRAITEAYLTVQQRQIFNQAEALRELSTPIVPVYEGVLVLPLVGIIDSRRAGQFIEGMLENITSKMADVVIIDITGVRVIDTGVANYLLQAARAARLLGSQVVLVGIGAEIAQTMVQLGIDLTSITTRADLQSGIAYALEIVGKQIVNAS